MSKSVVPAERISKVEEYYFSIKLKEIAKMNAEGAGVINLGIGSPDMPPTLKVREMLAKSAMVFTLPHTSGSLSKILAILSFYDMNLTMIQSLPIVGKEWEYQFYINLLFDDYMRYRQAVEAIRPLTGEFQIMGENVDGRQSVND